ncbi:hypothetical protein ACFL4T_02905, partial [candidate division KSB1 bacterium]
RRGIDIFLYNDIYQILRYYNYNKPSKQAHTQNLISTLIVNDLVYRSAESVLKIIKSEFVELDFIDELLNWLSLLLIGNLWEELLFGKSNQNILRIINSYNTYLEKHN